MVMLRHLPLCSCLKMKPLNEKQRDSVLAKILRIGAEKNKGETAIEVVEELKNLKNKGYDVDSYFLVFSSFIGRYGLKG